MMSESEIEATREASDCLEPSGLSAGETPARGRFARLVSRSFWPILYVVTIVVIVWWYESGAGVLASSRMQGVWQQVEGEAHLETLTDNRFLIDGNETWFTYPMEDDWTVLRSRISIRPADGFFLVKRTFGFDWGNTRETEYIVFLRGNQMYLLHGLAKLDPMREYRATKYRRADQVPDEVSEAIDDYLVRHGEG